MTHALRRGSVGHRIQRGWESAFRGAISDGHVVTWSIDNNVEWNDEGSTSSCLMPDPSTVIRYVTLNRRDRSEFNGKFAPFPQSTLSAPYSRHFTRIPTTSSFNVPERWSF